MKLKFSEIENNVRLIELNGSLDLNGTYSIEIQFVRACEGNNTRVIVDLSQVSYISSVGIAMLVNATKSLIERGGKLVLLDPQKTVADVLEMTGISEIIRIFSDFESAQAEVAVH